MRSLYEAHQPWRNVEISWTDKRSVLKYFDADLTRLLIEDGTCVRRTKEICRLDFDPIVGSQDFPDEGFKVEISSKTSQSTEALLDVRFQNVEVVTLRFRLRQRRGQWRIADITYPDGTTLKTILSPRKSKNPADKN
ncbi:MAG: DUF3828 domain-containing protein [Deltaproteobacteria bacterium]|nr:DUF3828 domain-containing protein [Deltaproteobacteria bacterium]